MAFAAPFLVGSWWLYRVNGLDPVLLLGALQLLELLLRIFDIRTAEDAPPAPAALSWLFVLLGAVETAVAA